MLLSEISKIVHGSQKGRDIAISSVSIDTRTLHSGDLYIAIKGENFDGNSFLPQAENAGAEAALLQQETATSLPHIIVDDTRTAMMKLARAWRRQSGVPLIGITGSNGKTTVKEMTAAILGVNANVLFTRGNLNNEIGVPLTLFRLQEKHRYAVIEMGANHLGEIRFLSQCAEADIAVITNVGSAHIEGFGSIEGVATEKGQIVETLKDEGVAVLNADDPYFEYWKSRAGKRKVVSFGLKEGSDFTARDIRSGSRSGYFQTVFRMEYGGQTLRICLSLAGKHNVVNALAASAACSVLNIKPEQIQQGLESVAPVTGRLQPMLSRQGSIIIDDTYNANPASLNAALDVLKSCDGEPWVVLGAFGELGPDSEKIHEEMGELIRSKGVVRVFAVGPDAIHTVRVFGKGALFFDSHQDLIDALNRQMKGEEALLIKGSRAQKMENIAETLVDNFRN